MGIEIPADNQVWVTTSEAEEITGYNHQYIKQLASKNAKLPDNERLIKVRMRSGRFYELWLPDLLRYSKEVGNGPHQNK